MGSQVHLCELSNWAAAADEATTRSAVSVLESGQVLYLPHLAFVLNPGEGRFLDPHWSDGRAKNISFDPAATDSAQALKGARGRRADLQALQGLLSRFNRQASGLVEQLLPHYRPHLHSARTSLRTQAVATRKTSWREDDSRLHVDAFPSRPNNGERILRVFANVNPDGLDRIWRVGEAFPDMAAHFWPRLKAPLPGSARLLKALHITKTRRSAYDHYMLGLHDAMKADLDYQRHAPQEQAPFAPGSVWLCFSDQTSHAAMSGQHMLEQTVHLPLKGMYDRSHAPLSVLEKLAARPLT